MIYHHKKMQQEIQKNQANTTILICVYNEQDNIEALLEEIFELYLDINVCVVDDGSTDMTSQKLGNLDYPHLTILKNENNKWLNFSICKWIQSITTKYFIVMDGDFQHPVSAIWEFLKIFYQEKTSPTHIVIWERNNISYREFGYRAILSHIWIYLCNLRLASRKTRDPLSWFFGWDTHFFQEKIAAINVDELWYKILFNILKITQNQSNIIKSFTYTFNNRKKWYSKINFRIYFSFLVTLFKK